MTKLVWDQTGERTYENGIEQAALYPMSNSVYGAGVAWNGFTGFTQSPSGAETTAIYANDSKYGELLSNEEFGGTITAYTYPDEFAECDGSAEIAPGVLIGQQERKTFGLVYKTLIGNDTEGTAHGYKLHIVYGCKAKPSEKAYKTINDSPEAMEMSWEVTTTPVPVTGHKPTSHLEINSTTVQADKLKKLEESLYGNESGEAKLLLPDEVLAMMNAGQ